MSLKKKSSKDKAVAASRANYANQLNNASNNLAGRTDYYNAEGNNNDLLGDFKDYITNQYNKYGWNFYGQNADSLWNGFVKDTNTKNQKALQGAYNNIFGGADIMTNPYISTTLNKQTADQPFVDNFLQGYYDNAMKQFDTAKARGLLNEAGYNEAVSELGKRNSAANAGVNELTDAVLQNYQDDFNTLASNWQTTIDNYDLSNRSWLNQDNLQNAYNNVLADDETLQNAFSQATSGYTPYNVSDILANARNTQGVINPNSNDSELLATLKDNERSKQNKVGLGNQGIF